MTNRNPVTCNHCGVGPNGPCNHCGAPLPDSPITIPDPRYGLKEMVTYGAVSINSPLDEKQFDSIMRRWLGA